MEDATDVSWYRIVVRGPAERPLRLGFRRYVARARRRDDGARRAGRRPVASLRPARARSVPRPRTAARRAGVPMSVAEYTETLDERRFCEALKRGDEAAFIALVGRHHATLRRVALGIVRTPAVADEVVQEAWLQVVRGISRLRGPLVAEDVDLPHPHEHGVEAGRAGGAHGSRSLRSPGRRRARRRPLTVPRREPRPLARPLGDPADPLERASRGATSRPRDARPRREGDRAAPACRNSR